jgi:hypothetical protein
MLSGVKGEGEKLRETPLGMFTDNYQASWYIEKISGE